MKIEEYLKFHDISAKAFSRKIGISPSIIYAAINESSSLNLHNGLIIEYATNGDVKAIDLCSEKQKQRVKATPRPFKKVSEVEKEQKKRNQNDE